MGTRCGDIDPAIVFYLYKNLGMSMDQIEETLVKKSGLLGLTEVTSDCRYAEDNYDDASKPEAKTCIRCLQLPFSKIHRCIHGRFR